MAVLSVAPLANAQTRDMSARCREACQRSLKTEADRGRACGSCVSDPDPASWLSRVSPLPDAARTDSDWRVRLGWFSETAVRTQTPLHRVISSAIVAQPNNRAMDCDTAVRFAGQKRVTFQEEFAAAPNPKSSVRTLCAPQLEAVRSNLALEAFSGTRELSIEALVVGAAGLGSTPARLLLDVLNTRTDASVPRAAQLLIAVHSQGGAPAGLALLSAAKAQDTDAVNKLLAEYSTYRDTHRQLLSTGARNQRREAVQALAAVAPLSLAELTLALSDEAPEIRLFAARAIAAGEGRSPEAAAAARFATGSKTPVDERRRWLTLIEDLHSADCAEVTARIWGDVTQADTVRAQALQSLAGCAGGEAIEQLQEGGRSPSISIRVATALALGRMPMSPESGALADLLMRDAAPEVVLAMVKTVSTRRLASQRPAVLALLNHPDITVRSEALRSITTLDPLNAPSRLSSVLMREPAVELRLVAAELAPFNGTPQVISALRGAAQNDTDTRVKLAADAALRRLGITSQPRRIR